MTMIKFSEVEASMQNARLVMCSYLLSAVNSSVNKVLKIRLNKNADLTYDGENGKNYPIHNIALKAKNKVYTVEYNNNGDTVSLTDLSANELFMLCSIVDSFLKNVESDMVHQDTIDIECEVVE